MAVFCNQTCPVAFTSPPPTPPSSPVFLEHPPSPPHQAQVQLKHEVVIKKAVAKKLFTSSWRRRSFLVDRSSSGKCRNAKSATLSIFGRVQRRPAGFTLVCCPLTRSPQKCRSPRCDCRGWREHSQRAVQWARETSCTHPDLLESLEMKVT